jgi:phage tail-like protein
LGASAGFAAAMALLGLRNDPYAGFNFLVEIEGLLVGGFNEVTGLSVETEVEQYQEGGNNDFVHQLAGRTKYPNLVLKRGLTDIEALWSWHQKTAKGTIDRKNGTIYLLDKMRLPAMWWNFTDAYPIKWSGPDFRAEQNTVAVETVELVHRGIEKPLASSMLSAARFAASIASQALS